MTDPSSPSQPSPQRERLVHVRLDELNLAPNAPKPQPASPTLTESIRTYGILQPLLVRPGGEGYEVIAGFKRLQAARESGLKEVPVRVFRAEDSALSGFYLASNVQGDRRQRISAPPPGEYKPTGKLSGLLEEELNRKPSEIPYKTVLGVAAIVLAILWIVVVASRHFSGRDDEQLPLPDATPGAMAPDDRPQPPTAPGRPSQAGVGLWRQRLSGIDGLEVRDVSGTPRLVFQEPVFSQLVTIDPAQKTRLVEVANTIHRFEPNAMLMVIGHTDDDPIRPSSTYRSNEYLGELRANEVTDFLKEATNMPDSRLRPVSSGAEAPPFPNSTPADKARNRTVTLEIMVPRAR